jgi:hypothetical protein
MVVVIEAEVAAIFETVLPEIEAKVFPSKGLLLSSVLEQETKKNSVKSGKNFFIKD